MQEAAKKAEILILGILSVGSLSNLEDFADAESVGRSSVCGFGRNGRMVHGPVRVGGYMKPKDIRKLGKAILVALAVLFGNINLK